MGKMRAKGRVASRAKEMRAKRKGRRSAKFSKVGKGRRGRRFGGQKA
jgi:hypothetical protein